MKIIVPMAGMGKRMRPHTLTIPKPLIPIAGKPIVQRLVEDLAAVCDDEIEEIGFVIGDFGKEVEEQLINVAESLGAKGSIHYQREALGTAHAILCAQELLEGRVIVAFADTLFKANFHLDAEKDGILWVQKIEDPSQFGVVKVNDSGVITDYIEKPETFVSDLAMIGIYYFKHGEKLKKELQFLIDNDIIKGGEYQLPDALRHMTEKGTQFYPGAVEEWLDCGNKNATVYTNQRILELKKEKETLIHTTAVVENSIINKPVYLGEGAVVKNSVVGPHVSIGAHSSVENTVISNSIIQQNSLVTSQVIANSMVGNHVQLNGTAKDLSIGDYSTEKI